MILRRYTSADHATLTEWWVAHKWEPIPQNYLPEFGLVIEGLCAGFLYKTDSAFAWLEFVVSNPASDKFKRNEALDLLIKSLLQEAARLGFSAVHTSSNHKGLIERYERQGFRVTDSNVTQMVCL